MPGSRITSKQIEIYMNMRKKGYPQVASTAKAGFSERSGRDIEHGKRREPGAKRTWVTRQCPFVEVWEAEIIPLLKQGVYQATFVLEELQRKYAGKFTHAVLRSLQRKMRRWRALHGTDKPVIFLQIHEPGQLGVSDFTHPKDIAVTINKEALEHIFYHFRLPYSGWNYVRVFEGVGEPYTAFAQGLQEALHAIGGTPVAHRTDSLSASFKNLNVEAGNDLTERYAALAEHYGMKATRINPGKGHENGTIESSHRHLKDRIRQMLIIRGHNDFSSLDEYQLFIQEVTRQHNCRHVKNLEIECAALQPLPITKAAEYTEAVAVVSSTSTIDIKKVTYTVPSRLIGQRLHVKIYHEKLECYVGSVRALTLDRQHIPVHGRRARVINYTHVMGSLVKKPGAFLNYRFRNDLLPNDNYRVIWKHLQNTMSPKESCKIIVGLLHIAATHNCENELATHVLDLIEKKQQLKLTNLQDRFNQRSVPILPVIQVMQPSLASYNSMIPCQQGTVC
jgi:hypothetical protein